MDLASFLFFPSSLVPLALFGSGRAIACFCPPDWVSLFHPDSTLSAFCVPRPGLSPLHESWYAPVVWLASFKLSPREGKDCVIPMMKGTEAGKTNVSNAKTPAIENQGIEFRLPGSHT